MRKWNYRNTKLKEFLKKRSKRKFTPINFKYETHTITGYRINRNGKLI